MESSLPIINKTYEVYKAIIDLNGKLDKRWRYSLGMSTEKSILECFEYLIMAKNAPRTLKSGYLIKAASKHEITMHKIRLLLELKLSNETKSFQFQSKMTEIGRMIGGWLRSAQSG